MGPRHRAVDELTFEIARLFFRMRYAARQYLGGGRHSTGRRSVLRSLGREGPQTVPAMARVRTVSRQHVQTLVDELMRDGLVTRIENPRHRRSKLVALTDSGKAFLRQMEAREADLFDFLGEDIELDDLETATRVVRQLREALESDDWAERTK